MGGFESTRFTLFEAMWLSAVVVGGAIGGTIGSRHFGTGGAITGGIVGVLLGHVVGVVPNVLSTKLLFRQLARSSNEELWKIVNEKFWGFCQTMALLQLTARGQNVQAQLPRIMKMLESNKELERVHGWDALRNAFPKETELVAGYDPRAPAADCRNKIARLKVTS